MTKPTWLKPPDDFTIYRESGLLQDLARYRPPKKPENAITVESQIDSDLGPDAMDAGPITYFDQSVYFGWPLKLDQGHNLSPEADRVRDRLLVVYRARSLVCSCFNGSLCSITLRLDDETEPHIVLAAVKDQRKVYTLGVFEQSEQRERLTIWNIQDSNEELSNDLFIGVVRESELLTEKIWRYPHVPGAESSPLRSAPPFLFSPKAIVKALFPAIFRPMTENDVESSASVIKHGLIVISGQTGTLKSTILRLLLQEYLRCFNFAAWGKRRYPHVLTLEDPIEKPMVPLDRTKVEECLRHPTLRGINFTPRQIGFDVASLRQGLHHALRQTPAAVIVGETRDRKDWVELLKFASTGHLCLTTTHAGSLVETLRTIIEATGSTTPDLRSSLVEKIVAVVHLRTFDLGGVPDTNRNELAEPGGYESMLLPAIWRNVNGGANFFVSDGLGAILPRRAEGTNGRPPSSCRGRSDFARVMLSFLSESDGQVTHSDVARKAMRSDLEGI